jgi:5-methylcytosine-specific restriction endonuclease McrA
MSDQYTCTFCNEPIDPEEDHLIMTETGPFGLFEEKEIGRVHRACHDSIFEDDAMMDGDDDE